MSVGHIARAAEEAGIPTVIVATRTFRPRLEVMKLPRLLLTPYPMGRPFGQAGHAAGQRQTLLAAIALLSSAKEGNTILEAQHPYRPGR